MSSRGHGGFILLTFLREVRLRVESGARALLALRVMLALTAIHAIAAVCMSC